MSSFYPIFINFLYNFPLSLPPLLFSFIIATRLCKMLITHALLCIVFHTNRFFTTCSKVVFFPSILSIGIPIKNAGSHLTQRSMCALFDNNFKIQYHPVPEKTCLLHVHQNSLPGQNTYTRTIAKDEGISLGAGVA